MDHRLGNRLTAARRTGKSGTTNLTKSLQKLQTPSKRDGDFCSAANLSDRNRDAEIEPDQFWESDRR
jgi:hypothetical protein